MASSFDLRWGLAILIVWGLSALYTKILEMTNPQALSEPIGWGWLVVIGLIGAVYYGLVLTCNYLFEYSDEKNIECRIFGHSSKSIRWDMVKGCSIYKCKRCSKEYDVWDGNYRQT
jgi:hypothetical protein